VCRGLYASAMPVTVWRNRGEQRKSPARVAGNPTVLNRARCSYTNLSVFTPWSVALTLAICPRASLTLWQFLSSGFSRGVSLWLRPSRIRMSNIESFFLSFGKYCSCRHQVNDSGPNNQPTKKVAKGGVSRKLKTSSRVRLNHSCVRNALVNTALQRVCA
jgi:hypothetical protein